MVDAYEEADLYCAAFDVPVDDEVEWLLACLGDVRSILEPMCGHARYGPAFVARGVRYHGFDHSPTMLARAPRDAGLTVSRASAQSFALPDGPFDAAWCPINSIRHLVEDEELVAHLRCVHEHLITGGTYMVETDLLRKDGPSMRTDDGGSSWTVEQPDGSRVVAEWMLERCDLMDRLAWERVRLQRVLGDTVTQRVEHVYTMRLLTSDDWPALAEAGGFAIEQVYAHHSPNRRPPVALSRKLENDGTNYYFQLRALV